MNRYPSFSAAFLAINFTCSSYEIALEKETPKIAKQSVDAILFPFIVMLVTGALVFAENDFAALKSTRFLRPTHEFFQDHY